MMKLVQLVHWQKGSEGERLHGLVSLLLPEDSDDFQREAPYGYTLREVRAVQVGDRYFPLTPECPDDGLLAWTLADHDVAATTTEAQILALSPELREKFVPGFEAVSERKARRIREDAEADARAAAAKAAAVAEAEAADAALAARIEAAAAAIVEARTLEAAPAVEK